MFLLPCRAAQIVVHASGIASATVTAETNDAKPAAGVVDHDRVTFANLTPGTRYTLQLTHGDGSVDQGVDLGWYSKEPPRDDAGDITDDDKQQIDAILKQVLSFFNRTELTLLVGSHDRAVVLVQLTRDKSFANDKGGEVIWRPEVWYLKNRHGGWEKIQQTDKTLRRERFASAVEFHKVVDKLRWSAALGGLVIPAGQETLDVTPMK